MQADQLGIPVGPIKVSVNLKRDHTEEAAYEYSIKLDSSLSEAQRALLLQAADDCPVRRTLLKKPTFARRDR